MHVVCDKSQSGHVLGNLYAIMVTHASAWLILLDSWLLLLVGCVNIIQIT